MNLITLNLFSSAKGAPPASLSRRHIALESVLVGLVAAVFLYPVVMQKPTMFIDDGLFHFQLARLIWEQGPWVDIRWLPLTVLGNAGPDHHWFWHILISPFAMLDDPEQGMRAAIWVSASAVPALLNVIARFLRIPCAPLFALLAMVAGMIVPLRMVMLRAQNLALLLLMVAIILDLRKRWGWLALCAFVFMQSYHGAVLLLPISGMVLILRYLVLLEWVWRGGLAVGSGLVMGLALSPWVPKNVEYLLFHLLYKGGEKLKAEVGTEWYRLDIGSLAYESWGALVMFGMALLALFTLAGRRQWRDHFELIVWCAVTGMFLVMYKNAWRFAEYFVPFAAITAGLALRDIHARFRATALVPVTMVLLLALLVNQGQRGLVFLEASANQSLARHSDIAAYLEEHAQPNELIFNSNWSDFIFMMWHTRKFNYAAGLDGHFLAYANPEKYLVLLKLRDQLDAVSEDPATLIRETFDTRWALITGGHGALAKALSQSPHARLALRGQAGWLFELSR